MLQVTQVSKISDQKVNVLISSNWNPHGQRHIQQRNRLRHPFFQFLSEIWCVCVCKTHYIIKTHSTDHIQQNLPRTPYNDFFKPMISACFFQGHGSAPFPFGPSGPVTTYWKLRQLLASSRSCCLLLSCPWSIWRRPGRWTCGQRVVSTCFNMIQAIPEMITWLYNNNPRPSTAEEKMVVLRR